MPLCSAELLMWISRHRATEIAAAAAATRKPSSARWRIARAWGLGEQRDNRATRSRSEQAGQRGRFGWALRARSPQCGRHDQRPPAAAPNGRLDRICAASCSARTPRATASPPGWLKSVRNWFAVPTMPADRLVSHRRAHRGASPRYWGCTGKTGRPLRAASAWLATGSKRTLPHRWGIGIALRVVSELADGGQLSAAWRRAWTDQCPKIPYRLRGTGHDTACLRLASNRDFSDGTSMASDRTVMMARWPVTPPAHIDVFRASRNFGMFD